MTLVPRPVHPAIPPHAAAWSPQLPSTTGGALGVRITPAVRKGQAARSGRRRRSRAFRDRHAVHFVTRRRVTKHPQRRRERRPAAGAIAAWRGTGPTPARRWRGPLPWAPGACGPAGAFRRAPAGLHGEPDAANDAFARTHLPP